MRLVIKWASRGSLPFMKMLYPRKMDEVLWHSTTWRFSKSILVKMPRLPTIRVIGSQFISTRFPFLLGTSFVGAVIVLIRSLLFVVSRFLSTTAGDIQWSVAIPNDATLALCWRYSGS